MFGRRRFNKIHKEARTIVIQAAVRAYIARQKYKKTMRGIIKLQSHVRRKAAKKELKQLKVRSQLLHNTEVQKYVRHNRTEQLAI